MELIDLLALNIDEAAALAGVSSTSHSSRQIVELCTAELLARDAETHLAVTDGVRGAFASHRGNITSLPVLPVEAANTAGAGDAFLAGLIIGEALGYDFVSESGESAFVLGRMGSVRAVESLIDALSDRAVGVREKAAYALGELADERATVALVK